MLPVPHFKVLIKKKKWRWRCDESVVRAETLNLNCMWKTCLTCDVSLSLWTPFTDTDWLSVVWSRLVLFQGESKHVNMKSIKQCLLSPYTDTHLAHLAAESCMWLSVSDWATSSAGGGVGGRLALSSSSRLL